MTQRKNRIKFGNSFVLVEISGTYEFQRKKKQRDDLTEN